jgi:AraC-like DNA-binding protein
VHFFEHIYRQPQPIADTLCALAQRMASGLEPEADVMYRLAEQLLGLQGLAARDMARLNARTPATREERYRRLLAARDALHDLRLAPLSIHDMARLACMSPFHFHRSFREAFGVSPGDYFRGLKMEYAREQLASGRHTVTAVALECGFADVFSFSKAFKKYWGKSPGMLRAG